MEWEVVEEEIVLPTELSLKRIQTYEKYPKGQSRNRHWKHLRQILQADREYYLNHLSDDPTYSSIESPPSLHPAKKTYDITGFEEPYSDPRTRLQYANT